MLFLVVCAVAALIAQSVDGVTTSAPHVSYTTKTTSSFSNDVDNVVLVGSNVTKVASADDTMGQFVIGSGSTANTLFAVRGGFSSGVVSVTLTDGTVKKDDVFWVQVGGGIGMSKDGSTLYVANSFRDIRAVSPSDWGAAKTYASIGAVIQSVTVGSSTLYAMTDSEVYAVTVPKASKPKEFPSAKAFSSPKGVALSDDEQILYVLDSKGLNAVDISSGAPTLLTNSVAGFDYLAVGGGNIYAANKQSGGIVRVDPTSGLPSDLVAANGIAGMSGIGCDPSNANVLYVTADAGGGTYDVLAVASNSIASSPQPSGSASPSPGLSPTPSLSPGVSPSPSAPSNGSSPSPGAASPTPSGSPKPHKVNGFIEFFDEHAWAVYTIVGIAGAAILISGVLLLMRRYQRKQAEKAPLLPQSASNTNSHNGGGGGSDAGAYGGESFNGPGHSHTSRATSPGGRSRRGSRAPSPTPSVRSEISEAPSERRRRKKKSSRRRDSRV